MVNKKNFIKFFFMFCEQHLPQDQLRLVRSAPIWYWLSQDNYITYMRVPSFAWDKVIDSTLGIPFDSSDLITATSEWLLRVSKVKPGIALYFKDRPEQNTFTFYHEKDGTYY